MDRFLKYFYQDFGRIFKSLIDIVVAIFDFLNNHPREGALQTFPVIG